MLTAFWLLLHGRAPRTSDGGLCSLRRHYGMRGILSACPYYTVHHEFQLPQPQYTYANHFVHIQGRWPGPVMLCLTSKLGNSSTCGSIGKAEIKWKE